MMLTPYQIAAGGSEHDHQAALFQWIVTAGIRRHPELEMLHAIPNGGERSKSSARQMKVEGVKKGVPDLSLPVSKDGPADSFDYHGLYIEMKQPVSFNKKNNGRQDDQMRWHRLLRHEGYAVALCGNWASAAWVLHLYLTNELRVPADDALICSPCEHPPSVDETHV